MLVTNANLKTSEYLCPKGKGDRTRDANGISRQVAAYVAEIVLRVPVQTITSTITVVGEK